MTRLAYPLALILGALSACAVFAAGEAIWAIACGTALSQQAVEPPSPSRPYGLQSLSQGDN